MIVSQFYAQTLLNDTFPELVNLQINILESFFRLQNYCSLKNGKKTFEYIYPNSREQNWSALFITLKENIAEFDLVSSIIIFLTHIASH